MSPKKKKKLNFEEATKRLETIVERLEDGDISLDESIELFQEGRALGKECAAQLAAVEKKARLLIEKEDGSVEEAPLDVEGEEADDVDNDNDHDND